MKIKHLVLSIVVGVLLTSCMQGNYHNYPSYQEEPEEEKKEVVITKPTKAIPATKEWVGGSAGIKFYAGTYAQALAEARKTGKGLILDFGAKWCGPCKLMDKNTFSNLEVGLAVNKGFIALKIDVEQFAGMDIAEKYRVSQYPTVIFLDSKGKTFNRIKGYFPPESFLVELNKPKSGSSFLSSL